MDTVNSFLSMPIVQLAIGIVVGALVTRHYAVQGSKELKREAAELKQEARDLKLYNRTMLLILEDAGYVKLARNEQGEITGGRIIEISARAQSRASASARAEVIRGDATTHDKDDSGPESHP